MYYDDIALYPMEPGLLDEVKASGSNELPVAARKHALGTQFQRAKVRIKGKSATAKAANGIIDGKLNPFKHGFNGLPLLTLHHPGVLL